VLGLALLGSVLFLAYANGANDNFKGVATLYGSRTASYRVALTWATVTTLAGPALALALALASGLTAAFSGRGLVPDEVAARPATSWRPPSGAAYPGHPGSPLPVRGRNECIHGCADMSRQGRPSGDDRGEFGVGRRPPFALFAGTAGGTASDYGRCKLLLSCQLTIRALRTF
jgi:hypothetical protein